MSDRSHARSPPQIRKRGLDRPLNNPKTEAERAMTAAHEASSNFHGVTKEHSKWAAKARLNGKQHTLGSFTSQKEAALAYDEFVRCARPTSHRGISSPDVLRTGARAQPRPGDELLAVNRTRTCSHELTPLLVSPPRTETALSVFCEKSAIQL